MVKIEPHFGHKFLRIRKSTAPKSSGAHPSPAVQNVSASPCTDQITWASTSARPAGSKESAKTLPGEHSKGQGQQTGLQTVNSRCYSRSPKRDQYRQITMVRLCLGQVRALRGKETSSAWHGEGTNTLNRFGKGTTGGSSYGLTFSLQGGWRESGSESNWVPPIQRSGKSSRSWTSTCDPSTKT